MSFFSQLKQRRIFQIVAAFTVAGWAVLAAVGDLVERGVLPEFAYRIGLVWYIGGVFASLVIGWYHGEKGRQEASRTEIAFLSGIGFVVILLSGSTLSDHFRQARIEAADVGYDLSRVAVLYFDSEPSDGEAAYLADAFTEALIAQLQPVSGLDVISRNGVRPFRGAKVAYDSVGRALEAGTLIHGSVDADGGRIRVNVRLVDGSSGVDLDRSVFERDRQEAFAALDELVAEVSRLFRQRLGQEVQLRSVSTGTGSLDAWRAYQQGERAFKDAQDRLDAHDLHGALAAYARADSLLGLSGEIDPTWAEPPARRADVAYARAQRIADPEERAAVVGRGLDHAQRALELEPSYARGRQARGALRYLAWLLHLEHDPTVHDALLRGARTDLERAVELDPSLASGWALLNHLRYQPGVLDPTGALLAAQRAYETDAYLRSADDILQRLFVGSLNLEQFDTARRWCQEGARRFSDDSRFLDCQLWLMVVPGARPDVDRAWNLVAAIDASVDDPEHRRFPIQARMLTAGILSRADRPDSARAVLSRARERYPAVDDPTDELLGVEAMIWVLLDEPDRAIDTLKRYAVAQHGFERGGNQSWWWRELQDHPRFGELVTEETSEH